MKWLYYLGLILVPASYAIAHNFGTSIEEKINRLEIESGLKAPPEKTSFNVFGDFLLWKASLDGVAWATTAKIVPSIGGGDIFDDFKTRTVHFDYSPAFQIGAGVGLPYDHWDVSTRWLRAFSTGKDHAHGVAAAGINDRVILDSIGLIQGLLMPLFAQTAKAKCHVHLNMVDLVIGRTFVWSKYFSFRPFAGIRGAWLKLDWDINFDMPTQANIQLNRSFTDVDIDNHFYAGGFVGGIESKWNIYKGLGLFSYATASLIYGKSTEKTKQEFFVAPPLSTAVTEQDFSARNSTHTTKSVFDIAIGLKWETFFYKDYRILLRAGYDFFYWPSITQKTIAQFSRTRDRADLSFQGLVLGGMLDF